MLNAMLYHEPDERWSILGCLDYNTYLDRYLVRGLFHQAVPDDVKKSYETVEQLISHAWYHYPLYDEALNKLLRNFEMAVKLKCKLLSIPTTTVNKKNVQRKRDLVDLITDVCQQEPGKKLSLFLNYLRDLRNSLMHPDQHTFAGGIMHDKIQLAVNILNILFAPESFIVHLQQRHDKWENELAPFRRTAIGFNHGETKMLLHGLGFADIFANGQDEILLVYLEPVCVFNEDERNKNAMPEPIALELKNPIIAANAITGTDAKTGLNVLIYLTSDPRDASAANDFRNYVEGLKSGQISTYLTAKMYEISRGIQKFHYDYYQLIN